MKEGFGLKDIEDKIEFNKATAVIRRTKRQVRKESWRKYVINLNCNRPMKKVWKRIRKISGKYNRGRAPSININGNIETDHARVADAPATNIAHISSSRFYDPHFVVTKIE